MNTHPVITEFRELFTTNNPDMGKRFVDSMQEEAIESCILTTLSKQREEFLGMIDEIEEMIKRVAGEARGNNFLEVANGRGENIDAYDLGTGDVVLRAVKELHELREKVKGL